MGLMTEILRGESKKTQIEKPKAEKQEQPCHQCNGKAFWESIYADSVWHCETCDPAPMPEIVGKRIGQQSAPALEHQDKPQQTVQGVASLADDLADQFTEFITADGRTGIARRGYDNLRSPNYNQRVCAYVAIGVAEYDRAAEKMQPAWRAEMVR